MHRFAIAPVVVIGFVLSAACGQPSQKSEPAAAPKPEPAAAAQAAAKTPPAGKKEHVFRGKIEQVDANAQTLTVANENVEGWMSAMTMNYSADRADVYEKVKPGDQITAKVYDGDFGTLYDVQVVK
jgi:Cu/Ag efflux protein CusF